MKDTLTMKGEISRDSQRYCGPWVVESKKMDSFLLE